MSMNIHTPFSPSIRQKIIPAILAHSKKEFLHKLSLASLHYLHNRVQIDVLDGRFVPYEAWCNIREITKMKIKNFDAHLMTIHPERHIREWKKAGASRIFFHYEATREPQKVICEIKKYGLCVGIALNPETSLDVLTLLIPTLDAILLMGEHPGYGGQPFQKKILTRIKKVHAMAPKLPIIIDGGVTKESAPLLLKAGAFELASGHAALSPFDTIV